MDNAMHFFDELKKGMQQVEQAIEDWDYQDFSPDKRRALLEEQISNDVADDLAPETDAIQHIQDSRQQLNWSGLSPDDELADYDYGNDFTAANASSMGYETKVVLMSTPGGGIQGVPDADTIHRFMTKARQAMEPQALTQALASRLLEPANCWQIRSKVLVLVHSLIESVQLAPHYLPLFRQSVQLMQLLEKLRATDHNHIVRENARKALSLIRSNGANPMQIPRETSVSKQQQPRSAQVHAVGSATLSSVTTRKKAKPTAASATASKAKTQPLTAIQIDSQQGRHKDASQHLHTSPKIARAALASWRRRNSQDSQDEGAPNPNLLPFQSPPQMTVQTKQQLVANAGYPVSNDMGMSASHITTLGASSASRHQSAQMSAFTFIQ